MIRIQVVFLLSVEPQRHPENAVFTPGDEDCESRFCVHAVVVLAQPDEVQ